MDQDKFLAQPTPQATWDDYLDFKLLLIDNGDERVNLKSKFLIE